MCNLNEITEKITDCTIKVHGNSGPGPLESIYENALCSGLNQIEIRAIDRYDQIFEAKM
jgi:GxxExxY protein